MHGKLAFSFFYTYICIVILFLINLIIMNKRILTTIAVIAATCQMGFAQQKATGKTALDTLKAIGYFDNARTSQVRVIDESQMNNQNQVTNTMDAIRGRVAGLQVERNGSNALSAVRLRGTTSLTGGNDPLIIVDGVMGDLTLLQSVYPTRRNMAAVVLPVSLISRPSGVKKARRVSTITVRLASQFLISD